MKAKIVKAQTLQAKIQDTKTFNAIMRGGLVIHENIELSKQGEYIVWRTVGKLDWKRLIPIEELKVKGDKGDDGVRGYTPIKGVDYFDGYTPKKGIDYFDGVKGKDGSDGKDGDNGLSAFELWKLEEGNKEKKLQDFWNWLRREGEHIVMAGSLNVVPTGGSLGQVLKKKSNADYDLEWGTGGGGGGTVDSIVPGANIGVDNTDPANPIISVENLVLADITDVTATVTEINYVDGVTSNIQTQLNDKFSKSTDDTDDITVGSTNKFSTTAEKAKLANITVTQAVDLDTLESDTATNNAKVTNATHTGEMTGSGALTADQTLVSNKTLKSSLAGTEEVLINDAGTLKKTTAQDIADLGGGGGTQPYTALSADATITQGNVYGVTASTVDITLTLSDGTSAGQTLTVSKRDETDYSVYVNNATLDGGTIQLTIFEESIDLYRTGTTFIIK